MICLDPFKNINIVKQGETVSVSPCCLMSAQQVDTIDFYNNRYLTQIRNSFIEGEPSVQCQNCTRATGSNNWYIDHGYNNIEVELVRMDYWVGNTCNLRCVICNPVNSSSWGQELGLPNRKQNVNDFWKTINLEKIKFIHFSGGEPLLSKEHVEFLKEIPNPTEVEINYNTNGTILPSKRYHLLLVLTSHFFQGYLSHDLDRCF